VDHVEDDFVFSHDRECWLPRSLRRTLLDRAASGIAALTRYALREGLSSLTHQVPRQRRARGVALLLTDLSAIHTRQKQLNVDGQWLG
jgi:GAF domain-containing protein